MHCPGPGTAWSEGEGRPVCWVWGAAWPLRPMTHCPPSVLTILPASLVLSPCSPPFSPVVWAGGMTLLPVLRPSLRIWAGRGWGQRGKDRRRQRRGSQDRASFIQERTQSFGPSGEGGRDLKIEDGKEGLGEQVGRDRDGELERGRETESWRETERQMES